ncbi:hypothetical protein EUTSA_v10001154mg [Eutrema salsugineum]|uniref:KIB1-4 beta-propeller domain-containing protein n=1 Tax=Eutrema salsugineum TaxID=72664 RepID=V4LIY1_EUTSA|nr:hypothetical protein EUTSA_v10001154mg [Eutrema salsugineum]
MSQILSQVLKPVYKNIIKHYTNKNMVRWCSSTSIYPYLSIDHLLNIPESPDGCVARRSGSDGENEIIIKNKNLAKETLNAMTSGFNQSGVIIRMKEKTILRDTEKVRLNIYYKPSNPKAKFVNVHLPPLPKGCQTQNLEMSSLPDLENEDWVVVIKLGSQLKLYRHKDLRWIDIETGTHESVSPYSSLMYSKKDQRFYVPSPGGDWLCSFDQDFEEEEEIELKYDIMEREDYPQYMLNELEDMNSFTKIDHLVESPSGEKFLISWYYGDEIALYEGARTVMHRTKRFMVFKEKETENKYKSMVYTENIGDICIFLGHASSSPGLKANCIYFVGHNYGVYDITTQICTLFSTEEGPLRSNEFPYWPHPFSLTPH